VFNQLNYDSVGNATTKNPDLFQFAGFFVVQKGFAKAKEVAVSMKKHVNSSHAPVPKKNKLLAFFSSDKFCLFLKVTLALALFATVLGTLFLCANLSERMDQLELSSLEVPDSVVTAVTDAPNYAGFLEADDKFKHSVFSTLEIFDKEIQELKVKYSDLKKPDGNAAKAEAKTPDTTV
jgi:hypothetical protein